MIRLSGVTVALTLMAVGCRGTSYGHDIWSYLFKNSTFPYNKEVRPVRDWATPINVNISLTVIAVIDFNEVMQTIGLTSKLGFIWTDEYLTWNPADFGGTNHIHVSQDSIWKPVVVLENSVTKQKDLGTPSLQVIVHSDGKVQWEPVEVFHTTCATNVRQFPFDTQRCSMVFEALGYTRQELTIRSNDDHIDFHEFGGTTGWTVMDSDIETVDHADEDIHIICSLTLRRNPQYFILNIFLPIVLLSVMNICVFILPVQSGEKASFVITVFLALTVFLTIVSGKLPENSDNISLLNVYVFMNTLLGVLIAALTICQIRLYHRDPEIPVPGACVKFTKLFASKHKSPTETSTKENQVDVLPKTRRRQSVIDIKATIDENDFPRVTYNTLVCSGEVTWPRLVKALDNFFFLLFLIVNIVITATIFVMAIKEDAMIQDHQRDDEH